MNNYTVYAHINIINGKTYVGITSQNVKDRWKNGEGYKTQKFGRAIAKYGWDNFEHIIIKDNLSDAEATEMEKAIIKAFDLTNPKRGYNEAKGGLSGTMYHKHHTEDAKKKISEYRKAHGFSDLHRKHISESKSGVKHHLAKKVYQYTKDGKYIREWEYMGKACEELNIKKSNISECCQGKRPSAGGFIWSYERKE